MLLHPQKRPSQEGGHLLLGDIGRGHIGARCGRDSFILHLLNILEEHIIRGYVAEIGCLGIGKILPKFRPDNKGSHLLPGHHIIHHVRPRRHRNPLILHLLNVLEKDMA